MADNKVVIKINYDKKSSGIPSVPETVTVWHIHRILVALAALVLIVVLLVSWFVDDSENISTQIEPVEKVQNNINSVVESVAQPPSNIAAEKAVLPAANKELATPEVLKKVDSVKRPSAIILDRRVIRASLNTKPKDDEPGDPIKSPVGVTPNQPVEAFYFSEIRNMKGKTLFHQWLRNGQTVLQKQLAVKDKVAKAWSSKILSIKDVGEWQVQLTDKKGKVYSEVNFLVNVD